MSAMVNSTPATRFSTRSKATTPRTVITRTTRTATSKQNPRAVDGVATPTVTPVRKPLFGSDNAVAPIADTTKKQTMPRFKHKVLKQADGRLDAAREPIKAFLRIRPRSSDEEPTTPPYLTALSETLVRMTDPSPSTSRLRPNSTQSIYTFSKVFPPETRQADFFTCTALPLVRDLLDGQNGLLFAYGVTNSGKTYTIQGGIEKGEAGLLPRTLDVVFNSVEGLHSDAPFRPVRLAGVEYDGGVPDNRCSGVTLLERSQKPFDFQNTDQSILAGVIAEQTDSEDRDETVLKVDRNYEYSLWVSYAEVYNEKVFDLLGISPSDTFSPETRIPSSFSTPLPHSHSTVGGFMSCANLAALANAPSSPDLNNPLLVKRKALALKNDPDGGKYIAGLREIRVRRADEARAVLQLGQVNRRVFGTLANRASSRSHGIFTLKIMRVHKGCPNDADAIQTARLSIVDLAGSERANNTHNTGERLKEAGNINKSLMVLGQCMEALRANQKKLGTASPNSCNVKLGLVPFRHSKLTELFQDFFIGDGRAVMVVNVNPYDTGFDENSHVMKFSALTRDVSTTTVKRIPASTIPRLAPNTSHRKVLISVGGMAGIGATETHLDILEEDEEFADDQSEPNDPLVDALFEQVEELRIRLFESEMRCAFIESETRDEVMKEMEERMMRMERMFAKRLMSELEENQLKTDRKIDMLHQAGLIGAAARQSKNDLEELKEEFGVEASWAVEAEPDDLGGFRPSPPPSSLGRGTVSAWSTASELDDSPLAGKFQHRSPVEDKISGPIGIFETATEDEACFTDTEESDSQSRDEITENEIMDDDGEDSDFTPGQIDHASPPSSKCRVRPSTMKPSSKTPGKQSLSSTDAPSLPPELNTVKKPNFCAWKMDHPPISLEHEEKAKKCKDERTEKMHILPDPESWVKDADDSAVIIPDRVARKAAIVHAGENAEYIPRPGEMDEQPKKKKRALGKKTVVMDDEIEAVTSQAARIGLEGKKQGRVRRLGTRNSK